MPKRGRKTAWSKIKPKLEKIQIMASQGLNEKEIYIKLGLSHTAFYKCKNDHHELTDALEKGREEIIDVIQNTAYKLALGGIKTSKKKYIKEADKMILIEETIEESLPYFPAIQTILEKKRPKEWGKDIKPIPTDDTPIIIDDVKDDE
jgi:hypothetical protein